MVKEMPIVLMLLLFFVVAAPARADAGVCSALRGATVIAQDSQNTFLGKVTGKYNSDSIFNEYGSHGGRYSTDSIWNRFGTFGGRFSSYSPHNKFSTTPPMLIKGGSVIGYLSANRAITPSISPNLLKALCEDFF